MPTISLPANVEAERSVLGSMMCDPSAAEVGLEGLQESDFSDADPRNKIIFRAMKTLYLHHKPIDAQTVHDQLLNTKEDDLAGGTAYLYDLIESVINPDNIDHYIAMVNEQSVLRQLLLKVSDIQKQYAEGVPDIGEFIVHSNDEIALIAQKRTVQGMRSATEVANQVKNQIELKSRVDNHGLTGLSTGFHKLDEFTHGWQKGDLIILAARPSVGKTAFGLNLAYLSALKSKKAVGFFSLEMSADRVMERLIAYRSCVSNNNIQTGFLKNSEKVKVASAIQEISGTRLFFDDSPNAKLGDLIAKATKLKKTNPDLQLIVIDYLGRIRYSDKVDMAHQQQEVGYISGALKSLARQLDVPIICLAQLNRSVEQNDDKKPTLANLRDSGNIEQDADIVMLMYREDYYTSIGQSVKNKYQRKAIGQSNEGEAAPAEPAFDAEQAKKNGDMSKTTIMVAKNRNGQTGQFDLLFQKAYSRFNEPSTEFEEKQAALASSVPVDFPE